MRLIGCGVVLLIVSWASDAWAYPQYIGKGYTNCGTCHYSPTGGGLLNSYGSATIEATFPDDVDSQAFADLRETLSKDDVSGYDAAGEPEFQWGGGLDARLLLLTTPREVRGDPELLLIPMLTEVGAVASYGPVLAYGTVTPRRSGPERAPDSAFSREHWLLVKASDVTSVRAGRMVLPFGLRLPDHTQYTREDFGFDKWDQSYAIEVDAAHEDFMFAAAAFAGDLWLDPGPRQERGAAATFAYNVPSTASVGVSLLGSLSEARARIATSLFARWQPLERTYLLAELAAQHFAATDVDRSQDMGAGYLRAGWFLLNSFDLYLELGGRGALGTDLLTKARYGLGANWQIIPWIELAPLALLEEDVETGLKASWLVQLHAVY